MVEEFSPLGKDLFGDPIRQNQSSPVCRKFVFPPFSVLSARDGAWQERKRAWKSLGIEAEIAREVSGNNCIGGWRSRTKEQAESTKKMMAAGDGVLFDPVLCELMYTWFCPHRGRVLDPFAGGSVRGVVASMLGYRYWGSELRQEQVDANRKQVEDLCSPPRPIYVCGDSRETLDNAPEADMIFSCPPYGNLEVYSDDPKDLSNMAQFDFENAYRQIVVQSCDLLKPNRFACFVVGDYRDARGLYQNFVGKTVAAFEAAGLELYNEAVLVSAVGSASLRANRQFGAGRKLVKTHQNVLVFIKGSWKEATKDLTW